MLSWVMSLLMIGLLAGATAQIAWILFVVFSVPFFASHVIGRRPSTV
jgi:uncharacterized membrane protein YtjA (UPF0391 family)